MDTRPRTYKRATRAVAAMGGVGKALDGFAEQVAAKAKANAAGHGTLASDIKTAAGKIDRAVILDRDDGANIEFGHAFNEFRPRGSEIIGPLRWVPGLHVMRDAARRP